MIGEEDGLRIGTLLSIGKCEIVYKVGDEDITATIVGLRGDIVEMTFTREGLEAFGPLYLDGLPALVAKLDAYNAAEIADLEARGLRQRRPKWMDQPW
ncbi:MAG: hypothetical protein M3548_22750 [Actinomycetota bacterium]|nr:hypothetical protein [Actinomycetota bacterium]